MMMARMFFPRVSVVRNSVCRILPSARALYSDHFSTKFVNLPLTRGVSRCFSTCRPFYDYPKHKICTLPSLSPTMETGNITSWEKKVGDKLEEGDILANIETDKAVMSMETTYTGYLAKILIPENTKDIPINEPIAIIVTKAEHIDAFKDYESKPKSDLEPAKIAVAESQSPTVSHSVVNSKASSDRIKASPYAKLVANDRQVDLKSIAIPAEQERITSQDVLSAASAKTVPACRKSVQVLASNNDYEDIPVSNMRKVIAKRLTESKQFIPHYYLTNQIDVDEIIRLREYFNEKYAKKGIKLTFNDFIVKASSICLLRVPECNSSWMDSFIRKYNSADISVAVSTESGLYTPFIRSVEKMGLAEISEATKEIAKKAREGNLKPEDYVGGTFTISNLGMFGITNFSAVINPPQSCILAVGAISKILTPTEDGGSIVKSVMNVTLSCDHRVVDGAVGATWMKEFRTLMENPIEMLY